MCNLYSITANQAAIVALFRIVNRYVGNLAPMPGVFSGLSGPGGPQHPSRQRTGDDVLGHAATAARALHEYVELVTGRDAIKMLRERGKL
jgi:hypothetical protein